MHRLSFIPIALTLSFGLACAPSPKHRSWRDFTKADGIIPKPQYILLADVEQSRAVALETRDLASVATYAYNLGIYLWEVDQFLDARDRAKSDPEYKYKTPPEYVDFDRDALIAEVDVLVAELSANRTFDPGLEGWLPFVHGDCDGAMNEWSIHESCENSPAAYSFDSVRALCGDEGVPKVCRVALDRMADADQKYRLMKKCNEFMSNGNPKSRDHLAKWATAEELAFYDKMVIRGEAKADELYRNAMMAKASANAENERRMDEYAEEQSEYDANRPAIEQQSQIGSLDGSDQPPPAPVLITSVGVPLPDDDDGTQIPTDTVTLVLTNQCERDMAYQLSHSMVDSQSTRTLLPAKQSITLELPRCSQFEIYSNLETQNSDAFLAMTRAWTGELKSDCETIGFERPK
jgi:hypothetical protein